MLRREAFGAAEIAQETLLDTGFTRELRLGPSGPPDVQQRAHRPVDTRLKDGINWKGAPKRTEITCYKAGKSEHGGRVRTGGALGEKTLILQEEIGADFW